MKEHREHAPSHRGITGPTAPTPREALFIVSAAVAALLLIGLGGTAEASVVSYSSQSGSVSASGSTENDSGSDTQPFSGLGPVDVSANYEENIGGSPFAEAHAALQTTLSASTITISGATSASAAPVCCALPAYSQANAEADVDIEFTLLEDATLDVAYTSSVPDNGPLVRLQHQTIGFVIRYHYWFEAEMESCGSLTPEECDAIFFGLVIPTADEPVMPAGDYSLSFSLFAFQPQGSCAIGCNEQDGDVTLSFTSTAGPPPVPSSGPWALLGLGLALVGLARRRSGRPRA